MNGFSRYLPWLGVTVASLYLVGVSVPHADPAGSMQFRELGKIPVVENGRVKPLDTVARVDLMLLSGKQTLSEGSFKEQNLKSRPAVKWLADTLTGGDMGIQGAARKHQVFRIDNEQLLNDLGLDYRPGFYRYSIDDLGPKFSQLMDMIDRLPEDSKKFNLQQKKLADLAQHLKIYQRLTRWQEPLHVPPADGEGEDDWKTFYDAAVAVQQGGEMTPQVGHLRSILVAYEQNDVEKFNQAVADYQKWFDTHRPSEIGMARFETFFNHAAPFYHSAVLYVFVFLVCAFSWVVLGEPLRRTAFWLLALTLALHTAGLIARMAIQGRPPITNLYSTAVFIGWFAVLMGLFLEVLYRNSVGSVVGAVMGGLTSVVSHHLASTGDTLEMMRAVLDTNFWLATHVTIINIGYAATMFAGFLGIAYILLGLLTPYLDGKTSRALAEMIYGTVCFATMNSFLGTVLGGIWADQSWGRFWGWDPKENGALLIVIWTALILHARWCGMIKQRGLAVLAVAGNMVTAWSWFGTNQLGVGLHAYGFNDQLATGLVIFWFTQLAVIGAGMLPLPLWKSYDALNPAPKPVRADPAKTRGRLATAITPAK